LSGYTTLTQLSAAEKVGVVVFTNATSSDPGRFSHKAFEWVAPALVKAAEGAPKPSLPDPAWQAYVGTYRSRWGGTKVLVLGGKLVVITPLDEDPLEGKYVLVPAGNHTFRIEGQGSGRHGDRARFELDAKGMVKRLFLGDIYSSRVDPRGPVRERGHVGRGGTADTAGTDPSRLIPGDQTSAGGQGEAPRLTAATPPTPRTAGSPPRTRRR
jgi:hypothetical protein